MVHVLELTGPLPDVVVRYADHPDGLLDLHLPAGRPRGVVLLVHGGFWRAAYDRTHLRPLADALRGEGHLVASCEYRRTGATGPARGGWPATADDVREAARRLPGLLDGLGLAPPPGTPTCAVGHSAGGHLALLLAAEDLPVTRVVALAPVGDLHDAHARGLGDGAALALLGAPPEADPSAWAEADAALRLRPGGDVAGPRCPVVVLHGTDDDRVPVGNSDWAGRTSGVRLEVLPGCDHFDVVDPRAPTWPALLRAVAG